MGSTEGSAVHVNSDATTGFFGVYDAPNATDAALIFGIRNSDRRVVITNTATLQVRGIDYPVADGSDGQVMQTDGAGTLTFASRPYSYGGSDLVPTNAGILKYLPYS